ncbi:MAG: DUF3341 domain-containing protein [Polyangiaceae bacterium]|nr:DUF3341 domain-containing protein [Polyangiaceae bacterium]
MREAVFAEYPSMDALLQAIDRLRDLGHQKLDVRAPYAGDELRQALGHRRSILPWIVLAGGLLGAGGAYFLQWYLVAYLYPLNTGGRPPQMPLAFFVITFEMGVLGAALSGFAAFLWGARLFRLYDPSFEVEGIESASVDRFWLRLPSTDDDGERLDRDIAETSPLRVVIARRHLP